MSYSKLPIQKEKFVATNEDPLFFEHQQEILKRQQQKEMIGNTTSDSNLRPFSDYTRTRSGQANEMPILIQNEHDTEYDLKQNSLEFDAYHEYKRIHGFGKRRTRYNTYSLNIDSQNRTIDTNVNTETAIKLESNPLHFTNPAATPFNDFLLWISVPNHTFQEEDLITLTGLEKKVTVLNTVNYTVSPNTFSFIFTEGKRNIKITTNPNLTSPTGAVMTLEEIQQINTTSMFVEITGFIGNPTSEYFGNIPINTINNNHQIILYNSENGDEFSATLSFFFIQLVQPFTAGTSVLLSYNVTLTYLSYGTIPYNSINADYPVGANNIIGNHTVYSTTPSAISVKYTQTPYYNCYMSGSHDIIYFGGTNMYVSKITNILYGNPEPNSYKISLNDTFQNIIMARIKSSCFPNIRDTFFKNDNYQNNKLYWQNADDGEYVYSVELDVGQYDATSLCTALETKINATAKVTTSTTYTDYNLMTVSMDTHTNIVTFKSFKKGYLRFPITKIDPPINQTNVPAITYTIRIYQQSHKLLTTDIGLLLVFSGFIDCNGISSSYLNGTHAVTNIVDADYYEFQLTNINVDSSLTTNSGGGNAVVVEVPCLFRLLFNYSDTMGEVLGFRNVGNDTSITYYKNTITNQSPYYIEPQTDSQGNTIIYPNNSLQFIKSDYVLMTCKELAYHNVPNIYHFGKTEILNVFAKIHFKDSLKTFVVDTYADAPMIINDPIELHELTLNFYTPFGELFDFHNQPHSFILELTVIDDIPVDSAIISFANRQ